MLRALIWDVDGTVAETERDGHRLAFNQALREHGAPWQWDVPTYGRLLRVTGGCERLMHDMADRPEAPSSRIERDQLARSVHRRKNELYAQLVAAGGIAARPGVVRLMDECTVAGIALAVATTTSRSNVDALFASLFGLQWQHRFAVVVCAEDAPSKKPDPLAYRLALDRLGTDAAEAIAIEDSPNGLTAASAAGIATLVTRSVYFADDDFTGCTGLCDDLDRRVTWPGGESSRTDLAALQAMATAAADQAMKVRFLPARLAS